MQARALAELPRHRVVLAEAGRDRHGFGTELVAGLALQELDLEARIRPGDGEALAGGDLAVALRRVGALAPVHTTACRLVGQGQAAAGGDDVGDQLLGLGERLGSGCGDGGGSRLSPVCQLHGSSNAPVPPVRRRRRRLAPEPLELLASTLGQLGAPGLASTGDPNQVARAQGRGGDPMRVALHHAGRRAGGDPAQDRDLRIVQSDGRSEHGRLLSAHAGWCPGQPAVRRRARLPTAKRAMVSVRFGALPAQPQGAGRAPGPSGSVETAERLPTHERHDSPAYRDIEKPRLSRAFP